MPQVQQIIRGQSDVHRHRSEHFSEKIAGESYIVVVLIIKSIFIDLQTQLIMVQKEQQQNSERKRQLDVIDVIASKTAKKDGKKARIQKIGRQTAVDQQAQQAQLQATARFLPNSPHSMSPHGECLCLTENARYMIVACVCTSHLDKK